jgi:hypothetical protein
VEYQLIEDWSYANYIETTVKATSSIPNEFSEVQLLITPSSSGRVFRGTLPSSAYFELISSVFTSESSDWSSELMGYHVSATSAVEEGSSTSISEIPSTFGLQLEIYLDLSSSGLLTSRRLKQSTLLLFSSILGTYFGLMDIFGAAMEKTEENWLNYAEKRRRSKELSTRVQRIKTLMAQLDKQAKMAILLPSEQESIVFEDVSIYSPNLPSKIIQFKSTDLRVEDLADYQPWHAP